jgi:hypothetical protein
MGLAILVVIFNSNSDIDADGILDQIDNCPDFPNPTQVDSDSDLLGNECDLDDDNDLIEDEIDLFDEDPYESYDLDLDGIGDNADPDDDNDLVLDALDVFDTDFSEWADFDFDGIGSTIDQDDDNDGILDTEDTFPKLPAEELATKYLNNIQDCVIIEPGTFQLLCYSQFFDTLVENESSNLDAIELALALSKLGTVGDCHFISHQIGHSAFEENPDLIEILRPMDGSICRGGFFHGTLASYFHNVKENNKSLPEYKTLCNDLIGTANYQDCIHGLGHGLVHYYLEDLTSSLDACHQLSFYQDILCVKGVTMQYTDDKLTRKGITKENISNLCPKSELNSLDFQQCAMSIGSTLAFHYNHNFEEGSKSCELIQSEDTKEFCLEGLRLEIEDSKKYEKLPLTNEIREKFQPQMLMLGNREFVIDIRSPAIISDFNYDEQTKTIFFTFDKPTYIIMYIPNELLPKKSILTVNGELPNNPVVDNTMVKGYTMIRIVPQESGIVKFTPT